MKTLLPIILLTTCGIYGMENALDPLQIRYRQTFITEARNRGIEPHPELANDLNYMLFRGLRLMHICDRP